jgi:hypothetical protein
LSGGHSIQRVARPAATARHAPVSEIVQPSLDPVRTLDVRQGSTERPLGTGGLQDIARRAHAMGMLPHHLAAQARALLRNPRTGRAGSATSRLLLAGLDSEDEDDLVAFLTPVEGVFHDKEGLAKRFQQAEDGDELAELLKDLLPGQDVLPSDPRQLFEALKTVRYDPPALMALLAHAHGIPHPVAQRQELRQRLEDRLREYELTPEGAREAGRFRAAGPAAGLADPGLFLQTFEEVKTREKGGWVQQMQALAKDYPPQALPGVLSALLLAVGGEMRPSEGDDPNRPPRRENAHLGAINAELQQAHKCRSLLFGLEKLAAWILRLTARSGYETRMGGA